MTFHLEDYPQNTVALVKRPLGGSIPCRAEYDLDGRMQWVRLDADERSTRIIPAVDIQSVQVLGTIDLNPVQSVRASGVYRVRITPVRFTHSILPYERYLYWNQRAGHWFECEGGRRCSFVDDVRIEDLHIRAIERAA